MARRLTGKVALVTGASRGAGRGIARVLGQEGATVYVTGRTTRAGAAGDKPGTIEGTAEEVRAAGGVGIAVQCDHTDDEQVEALFRRLEGAQAGRLDLLVNNVWGGYEDYGSDEAFDAPFWAQPLWRWDRMFDAGVRAHYTASRLAAPLMMARREGLMVNTTFWDRGKALGSLPYDLAKTAINRLAYLLALELRPYGVAAVALSPGWMRTEAVLAAYDTDEAGWQAVPDLATTESTAYIGRAVAALAADPGVLAKSGQVLRVGDLAREYGFTDVDGRQPPAFEMPAEHLRD
ncbi:MAG: SDR family NAD(P)-dependent oxidoreductase [Anaerolineae bacterium]|jgi:NAD(P)-dependent dehydrogenase (short-subunit alcohol dehydrogenase family)